MSENYSFRSSMNGFNRNDVMACLEGILNEKAAAEVKASSLEEKVSLLEKKVSSLEEKCVALEDEKASVINENAQKLSYYENQFSDIKAAEMKSASLERELSAANSEIENLRFQLEKAREKTVVKDKCAECELARVYEARLGAAMFDAKRFSEILVKEANDKASALFDSAYSSADATSAKAKEISKEISDINKQFNSAFKVLLENMTRLDRSLENFKGEVRTTGATYNFSTDFEPVKFNKASPEASSEEYDSSIEKAVENGEENSILHNTDVNFDDADEFDIKVDLNAWKEY